MEMHGDGDDIHSMEMEMTSTQSMKMEKTLWRGEERRGDDHSMERTSTQINDMNVNDTSTVLNHQ